MIGAAGEKILPRRAIPQPHPVICGGGDCGACSLGGAIGLQPAEIYQRWDSKGITNRWEMERLIRCAASDGLADRILDFPVKFKGLVACESFGHPAYLDSLQWFNYIRLAIDAGYYAVAMVDYSENGGPETNHWVLICGARSEGPVLNKFLTGDVLASCSVKGERWYEARDFLKRLGGHDALLVRPS